MWEEMDAFWVKTYKATKIATSAPIEVNLVLKLLFEKYLSNYPNFIEFLPSVLDLSNQPKLISIH